MMKRILQIPFITGLIIAVFGFSIYCCCFQDIVQAKPELPPCHQTAQKTDQSHNAQECDCHKNILANDVVSVKDTVFSNIDVSVVSAIVAVLKPAHQVLLSFYPESPPGFESSLPLYIQHSVFRL